MESNVENGAKSENVEKSENAQKSDMSQNRDLESPNDRELKLMPKAPIESFWDALWLELWLFLCFMVECRRIVIWRAQTIEN